MAYHYQQLIGGEWTDAARGGTWDVLDPATEDLIRPVPFGTAEDARGAIEGAERAFPAWSPRTPYDRGAILAQTARLIRERAEQLGNTTSAESGKPIAQA